MKTEPRSVRSILPMAAVAALLVAGACSRKEEPAPQPTASNTATSQQSGPASDWSWADEPATQQPAPAAQPAPSAVPQPVAEAPPPQRIEPPPAAKPRATPRPAPPPREEPAPTNRLERAPAPPPEPEPVKVSYVAPAGTQATFHLDSELSSDTAQVGEAVHATLAADVADAAGHVVLPAGTKLSGTVTQAVAAKKTKKKSFLAYSLTSAELPDGTIVPISLGEQLEGKGWTKKDGAIIGGSAAGGALLGQILGHDTKSTAAGAVIGGAIGSGVAMSKKGEDVVLPAGENHSLPLGTTVTVERLERAHRITDTD